MFLILSTLTASDLAIFSLRERKWWRSGSLRSIRIPNISSVSFFGFDTDSFFDFDDKIVHFFLERLRKNVNNYKYLYFFITDWFNLTKKSFFVGRKN